MTRETASLQAVPTTLSEEDVAALAAVGRLGGEVALGDLAVTDADPCFAAAVEILRGHCKRNRLVFVQPTREASSVCYRLPGQDDDGRTFHVNVDLHVGSPVPAPSQDWPPSSQEERWRAEHPWVMTVRWPLDGTGRRLKYVNRELLVQLATGGR